MKPKIRTTEKPQISDEEILKNKPSFQTMHEGFMSQASKTFFSKSTLYWISGAAAATAITVILLLNLNHRKNTGTITSNEDTIKEQGFVHPPIDTLAIAYKEHLLQAGTAAEIVTCRGTRISIPENAFVNEDGSAVAGDVTFKYREFHNPVEIFQSGIPMQYDSLGAKYVFESAGMIDLLAEKNGKPLLLAKNKTIDVDLKSDNDEDRFNVYYLDTVKRNWVYQGRDLCVSETDHDAKNPGEGKSEVQNEVREFTVDTNYQRIIKPALASKNAILFKVDFDTKDFKELSAYKNILFEVSDNSIVFNKEWYTVNWDKIALKRTIKNDIYLVTLQKKDSVVKFLATPVFEAKQYAEAMRVYEQMKVVKDLNTTKPVRQIAGSTLADSYVSGLGNGSIATRSFKVNNMGIWNCDQPIPYRNFRTINAAVFNDKNTGKVINCKTVYVATLKVNILLEWNVARYGGNIGYNREHDNICFMVTYDEKIGIIDPVTFQSAILSGKSEFPVGLYSPIVGISELNKWIVEGV